MGHCSSLDLRGRVTAFVEAGHSCRAAARPLGVGDSCAIKLMPRQRRFGSPAPAPQGRPPGRGRLGWGPTRPSRSRPSRRSLPSPCPNSP